METFSYKNFWMDFKYIVTYSIRGTLYSSENEEAKLLIERETEKTDSYSLKTRLKITNVCDDEIFLQNAIPIASKNINLAAPSPEWELLINGKHKNELPAVCTAGIRDERFEDAASRLTEEGQLVQCTSGDDFTFYSDLLTVIKSNKASASFLVLSSNSQSTFCKIKIDKNGYFKELLFGGEFNCLFKPGEVRFTEWFGINLREDVISVIDEFSDFRAKERVIRHNTPSVFSTWYYYGREITSADVKLNLLRIKEKNIPFSCFQIDDGWEKCYGDWEANEKFPDMVGLSEKIRSQGMMAGIWTCPFIVGKESDIVTEHPDWLLRHTDGTLCRFTKNYVLDITNPEVLIWIKNLYKKIVSWGFSYHKLDFTRAFTMQRDAVFFNPYITPVEAYINAMNIIRNAIGDDSYLEVCGGLYDPLIGIADSQRTGADVRSMWSDIENNTPRIPVTNKQHILRYFMNKWWDNNPDSLMVRRNEKSIYPANLDLGILNDEEAKIFTLNQYAGGGLVCSSENLSSIDADRLMLLRHILPYANTKVHPLDIFGKERYPQIVDVDVNNKWHTICIFNYSDKSMPLEIILDENLAKEFINKNESYSVSEFFSGMLYKKASYGDRLLFNNIEAHSCAVVKIATRNEAQIIKSNMHFSMGGEIKTLNISDNILEIEYDNPFNYPTSYTILLPAGYTFTNGDDCIEISSDTPTFRQTYKLLKFVNQ